MDFSLLSAPASEYTKLRTQLTVRSANSPSYLTRRAGIRRARASSEESVESSVEVEERGILNKDIDRDAASKAGNSLTGHQAWTGCCRAAKGGYDEKETSDSRLSSNLTHDDTADKSFADSCLDRSPNYNPASKRQGRTEWRRRNLPGRSKSHDWRARRRSPDWVNRPLNQCMLTSKQGGGINKQEGKETEGMNDRVTPSVKAYNTTAFRERSPRSPLSQTLDRNSRGNSLPFRLKTESSPFDFREMSSSLGTKGGHSILERIEQLYESAGCCKTEDLTPIKHFFSRDSDMLEGRGQNKMLFRTGPSIDHYSWSQRSSQRSHEDTIPGYFSLQTRDSRSSTIVLSSESLPSYSRRRTTNDSMTGRQGRDEIHGGRWNWGRGPLGTETMSLDRARSRECVAAKIRSARAAMGTPSTPHSEHNLSKETSLSDSYRTGKRRETRSKDWIPTNRVEENGETMRVNVLLRERSLWKTERFKEADRERPNRQGVREAIEMRGANPDNDMFESNAQGIRLTIDGRKANPDLLALSAASVRSKINQFEALMQRAQSISAGQAPRRAFSVPTQLNRPSNGLKKNGSVKDIGEQNRWDGQTKKGEASRSAEGKEWRLHSDRASSIDKAGLRLGNKEKERTVSAQREGNQMDSSNIFIGVLGEYSSLKHTLEIPINGDVQQHWMSFYTDEPDSAKVSNLEEAKYEEEKDNNTIFLGLSDASEDGSPQHVETLGVSDNDKTPTNSPGLSPLHSPKPKLENVSLIMVTENESASMFSKPTNTPEQDPDLNSSCQLSNLLDPVSQDANTNFPHGKRQLLDLNAWVAGSYVWKDDQDSFDDDDDDSTARDEDSDCDSDSGESSATITSNTSQSDRRSFCVSLSDLCNFAGVESGSENDMGEWHSIGRRSASLSSDVSAFSCVSVLPSEELDRLLDDVRSLGDNAMQNDVHVVVLHKEIGVGLGFSLAGGVDQNKPVTVHKVFHTGIAAEEGSIQEGDRILSINGTSLCDHTHLEVLRVLRRAKTRQMGVVVLRRGGVDLVSKGALREQTQEPLQAQCMETGQCFCVCLEKNSRDLGFSLQGGAGQENTPLTVQKIFQGGPVDKVCPGDEVVEIRGMSLVGLRRLEAWTMIRRLPLGPVDVVLRRPYKILDP